MFVFLNCESGSGCELMFHDLADRLQTSSDGPSWNLGGSKVQKPRDVPIMKIGTTLGF